MTLEYQHRVAVVRNTKDGDSYGIDWRVTPHIIESADTRLQGFDCPESRRPASPYEIGKAAEAYNLAVAFLNAPGDLWCRRELKREKYGRELVTIWHDYDGIATDLGEALFDAGLAVRWPTRWWQTFDPQRNKSLVG